MHSTISISSASHQTHIPAHSHQKPNRIKKKKKPKQIQLDDDHNNSVDIPRSLQHISSIASGIALLYYTLQLDFLKSFYYMLGFTFIEYCLLLTLSFVNLKNFGHILTPFCLATLLIGFVFLFDSIWWMPCTIFQFIFSICPFFLFFFFGEQWDIGHRTHLASHPWNTNGCIIKNCFDCIWFGSWTNPKHTKFPTILGLYLLSG